jgi:hypothetical protein
MEIAWTRMTGQNTVECSPVLISYKGQSAILAVNRAGQVMLWHLDGTDLGPGQDGLVAQLPKGTWSSTPTAGVADDSALYWFCSGEGHIITLDQDFKTRWEYDLGAETRWGTAHPAAVTPTGKTGLCMCWGDSSGKVTCLDHEGDLVWTTRLEFGGCNAPLQTLPVPEGPAKILAASGDHLYCLDSDGRVLWSSNLRGAIISQPEILELSGRRMIFCGAGAGSLFALTLEGKVLWEAPIGDEIDSTIALLPRLNESPLILCKGLWGNLHAFDENGRHVWTHLFRAKSRCRPLVLDTDGDGNMEVLVTAYNQHVYVFDHEGRLLDDLRLSGCINGSPMPICDSSTTRTDALVVDASLLAHRIRFSPPRSPYGVTPAPGEVKTEWPDGNDYTANAPIVVRNPAGAFLNASLDIITNSNEHWITGCLTARSMFELSMPFPKNAAQVRLTVSNAHGLKIIEEERTRPSKEEVSAAPAELGKLAAWPTPAYGLFDESRLIPTKQELTRCSDGAISIPNVYIGEIDQGAFVVACSSDDPCLVRVEVDKPVTPEKKQFAGGIELFEVVSTGTVNGERVPDALVKLSDARVTLLAPKRAAKFWVSVNAKAAEPGEYRGQIKIEPLQRVTEPLSLDLRVNVLPLRIERPFPLTLCTWDYIPNQWFPNRISEVLDDMALQGVTVFPRATCVPKASVDDAGRLTIEWPALDAELQRLKGRGQILIQLGSPPITFVQPPAAEKKRTTEIDYLHQLRDHLRREGWDYADYAFYPLDEPGLDHGPNLHILIEAAELFREADPKFRIYADPVPGLSLADFNRIEPLIDVWCPNMRLVTGLLADDPRIKRILDSGKTVWSYECVSQVKSISPLRYNRSAAWRAHYFGLTGIGLWTFSTTEVDHWLPGKGMNDEYALVYPGVLPVPSIRWEAVRDGLEDIAAVKLLEQAIASNAATGDKSEIIKEAQDALRIAKGDMMELSDQAFIESRDYLRAGDRTIRHTWTDVEACAAHRDRIARLTLALMQSR